MKVNKYIYSYILQGNYGYGWDDLTSSDTLREAKQDKKIYMDNDRAPFRIIQRREINQNFTGA